MDSNEKLASERFPRSAKYHPDWVLAGVSGGGNPLWMTEWLAEASTCVPACGCWTSAAAAHLLGLPAPRIRGAGLGRRPVVQPLGEPERIRDAGVEDGVFPIHADAVAAVCRGFFDAIV